MASAEFVVVVKRECETCQMVGPVLASLKARAPLTLWSQDDPAFPEETAGALDDRSLAQSWKHKVEIVPTLIRMEGGREVARTEGWNRADWARLTGIADIGKDLPPSRPGCGSITMDPGMPERLALKFGDLKLASRPIEVGEMDDPHEVAYDRGWSDGLPVIPPTDLRIARMLGGTTRKPGEILGLIPPNLAECTVEKAAVNAVLAGCRPDHLPVLIAAVAAMAEPKFNLQGVQATTNPVAVW